MPFYKDHLNYDGFRTHCIGTQYKFVWFPVRCHFTKRWLWLEYAYKQTAMWTGPDDPVFEVRYYDKNEFLVNMMKGIV